MSGVHWFILICVAIAAAFMQFPTLGDTLKNMIGEMFRR